MTKISIPANFVNKMLEHLLPDHLQQVEITKTSPPATKEENDLPFGQLTPAMFERFCCEFLSQKFSSSEKSEGIVRIEPIGSTGQKQYGADIFVKRTNTAGEKYELYEAKRVENFNKNQYLEAVKRFVKNHDQWEFKVSRFCVITSSNLSAQVIAEWQRAASELPLQGVEFDFITPLELQRCPPALVYQFFHPAWLEKLFGKQALWHYEQYGVYNFEEPAAWRNYCQPIEVLSDEAIVAQNEIEKLLAENSRDLKVLIQNAHVRIEGGLPTLEKNSASCTVELRNGKFSHVNFSLDHLQLVQTYFEGHYTPPKLGRRAFLFPLKDGYLCDIGNCRIKISEDEAEKISEAFDQYWEHYARCVSEIEKTWGSTQFEVLGGLGADIPLLTIKRSLWATLLEFARAHDAFDTKGDWSMFDSGTAYLKIYTRTKTNQYDAGYHAFIRPTTLQIWGMSYTKNEDDVLLVLESSEYRKPIGPRYYWDAETTHDWIIHKLIPHVVCWQYRLTRFIPQFATQFFLSLAEKWLLYRELVSSNKSEAVKDKAKVFDVETLAQLAEFLQSSYICNDSNSVYLKADQYQNLYAALHKVLCHSSCDEGHVCYMLGKLEHLNANNLNELVEAVHKQSISASEPCFDSSHIDLTLRVLYGCLAHCESSLNEVEARQVAELLSPLSENIMKIELLERQRKRLSPLHE